MFVFLIALDKLIVCSLEITRTEFTQFNLLYL